MSKQLKAKKMTTLVIAVLTMVCAFSINNDSVFSDEVITVTSYIYVSKPKITDLKVKYNSKTNKIVISGKAKGVKKIVVTYKKVKKNVTVKSNNKFTIKIKYKGNKNIALYGMNSKNQKITNKKNITSESFVTEKVICNNINRTKDGITYSLNTCPNSVVKVKYKGKTIMKKFVKSTSTTVFISQKNLKGKKGKLAFTQKTSNKRISQKCLYKILNIGESQTVSY